MILPDANVLIYALRRDLPQHRVCRHWLASVVSGDERFGISPLVLSALVPITTNPRTFRMPSSIDEAFGFCEDLLGQPHCQVVHPGERHWEIFKRLCVDTDTRGSRVPLMPGLPRSRSSGAANGSRSIVIMPGSLASDGERRQHN